MTIAEALRDVGYPVCHPPYTGDEETYITYQLLGQESVLYAEGTEAETGVSYAVGIFTEASYVRLMLEVKAALEIAGYVVVVEMEHYDKDTKRRQVSLIASIEGAEYG